MPKWERTAQEAAEAEHPPAKESQDEPKFRPAWGAAIVVLLVGVALIAWMISTGWSYF